ncbi:MAG: hypothetical protein ABT19_11370 [Rhodanobacter sp. SCN 68-63]|nr:MAG: hypothetical protein ABT19_11370 [Rhodanobacter sp. SCN 68-63]
MALRVVLLGPGEEASMSVSLRSGGPGDTLDGGVTPLGVRLVPPLGVQKAKPGVLERGHDCRGRLMHRSSWSSQRR